MPGRMSRAFARFRSRVNGTSVAGAVRGVFGDRLPQKWQGQMQFCAEGKVLDGVPFVHRPHVCIFVHGSSDTELGWQAPEGRLSFGDQLFLDFSAQPLYVRYNSGLSIAENGMALASLLAEFARVNKPVRRITLIGHSMGGLVIHAAVYDARARKMPWLKKVKTVFLLGTPHAGAPLAKLAEKGEQLLQFIPNPFTLIAASVIGMRSKGLKDLSLGQKGITARDPVLLPHAKYVFIAGGLQNKRGGFINRLIGDGMVRQPSALPKSEPAGSLWRQIMSRIAKSPDVRIESAEGVGHLALRHAPGVYSLIARHLR